LRFDELTIDVIDIHGCSPYYSEKGGSCPCSRQFLIWFSTAS
jgi:hypothetical protein